MLYWSDPPQLRNCGLRVGVDNPLPSSNAVVEDSVGNEYPSCVVTPNGQNPLGIKGGLWVWTAWLTLFFAAIAAIAAVPVIKHGIERLLLLFAR
jgi:hypothetical protein